MRCGLRWTVLALLDAALLDAASGPIPEHGFCFPQVAPDESAEVRFHVEGALR
jgi:hypothetical protein